MNEILFNILDFFDDLFCWFVIMQETILFCIFRWTFNAIFKNSFFAFEYFSTFVENFILFLAENSKEIRKKNQFLTNIFVFDQNFNFWPKFQFLTKFWFFLKYRFLTKVTIFAYKFDLWPNFFLIKVSIFDKTFEFWPKFQCSTKVSLFDPNFKLIFCIFRFLMRFSKILFLLLNISAITILLKNFILFFWPKMEKKLEIN